MTAVPLLEVDRLSHSFPLGRSGWFGRNRARLQAVQDVSFRLDAGRTLGIVGESGSGKSTLARCIIYLHRPESGDVRFQGRELRELDAAQMRSLRRDIAMVFQNPYTSLDPTWTVEMIVGEPLHVQGIAATTEERRAAVADALQQVGLDPTTMQRRPAAFSGGQRQRIAIARALVTKPALVVCDEAVSALDVSTQAQVLQLLHELQSEHGLAYLFITHDLKVAQGVSDDIAVMYAGRIVEFGRADQVMRNPQHPYTQALLAAAPRIRVSDDRLKHRKVANPIAVEPEQGQDDAVDHDGCPYEPRCVLATQTCRRVDPSLDAVASDWRVACHAVTTASPTADSVRP